MLFDEPNRFYGAEEDEYWDQGDVVLAPSAVFDADASDSDVPIKTPGIGETARGVVWHGGGDSPVPPLAIEAGVCPAMVTTHACTIDKEFNRAVARLRRQSMPLERAIEQAAGDDSLDRLVTVAPVVPFQDAAPSQPEALRENRVIGYFPLCEAEERGLDETVVDLARETTIDRGLILARLAVLSSDARAAFRYALARFWVYRAPKLTFELEEAVGKRITAAEIQTEGNFLLELRLSDGSTLTLLQAPSEEEPGMNRPPGSR